MSGMVSHMSAQAATAFHGTQGLAEAGGGVRIALTRCAGASRLPSHRHEHPFASFLLSGRYREGHGAQWDDTAPNTLTWHPAGDRHAVEHGPDEVVSLQIEFDGTHDEAGALVRGLPARRTGRVLPQLRDVARDMRSEIDADDAFSRLGLTGLVWQMLAVLGRDCERVAPREPAAVARAVDGLLREAFPDMPDLVPLARRLGLPLAELTRVYRQHTGRTPGAAARRLRVRHACELLRDPGRPLARVALDCGFFDQPHFTRVFRSDMRCTPGRYRARILGE